MATFALPCADRQSTLRVVETGIAIKTDSITQLIGANNYQTWEMQFEYLLISNDSEVIVLGNI
jgi:hypothetical protein